MKILLVTAPLAMTLNSVATAEVLAGTQTQKALQNNAIQAPHVVTGNQANGHVLEKANSTGVQPSKWTWIPAQRSNDGAPQTQIVAIPVPAPGAAALIGLSSLLVSRRRNGA